jgi:hypothetical protein
MGHEATLVQSLDQAHPTRRGQPKSKKQKVEVTRSLRSLRPGKSRGAKLVKGMIRSPAEAIGGGCICLSNTRGSALAGKRRPTLPQSLSLLPLITLSLGPSRRSARYGRSAVTPGHAYDFFRVHHQGVDSQGYVLLLYCLFLEPGLAHKLSCAKSMGLGSVNIESVAVEESDLRAGYRRSGDRTATRQRLNRP